MLKRVLIGLLVVLAGLSGAVAFNQADVDERLAMQRATSTLGPSFAIPATQEFADPDLVYPAISAAALAAQVNVFRTSVGYDADERPQTTHFVFLGAESTTLFDSFRLREGSFPSVDETREGSEFVSTLRTIEPAQVGVLADIGENDRVSIRPLDVAFESLPVSGGYVLECGPAACAQFLADLAAELGEATGLPVQAEDLAVQQPTLRGADIAKTPWLAASVWALVIVIAILAAYRQLYEAKRAGVMRLHGFSATRTWFAISGRTILLTMLVSGGIALIVVALIPGSTLGLLIAAAFQLVSATSLALLASLLTLVYIHRVRVSESIKNRKDTRLLFVLSTILKIGLSMALIIVGAGIASHYAEIDHERAQLDNWQSTSQYGVFYPKSIGNDLVELEGGQAGSTAQEVYELYPALNDQGALFVYAAAYQPQALAQEIEPGGYRSMRVNPNYLAQYPVLDDSGAAVSVDDGEADWVLLVPATLRSEEQRIRNYFQIQRTGDGTRQGVVQAERAVLGRDVPEAILTQEVRIIWIQAGQDVFTFDPLVNADAGNVVRDPIVEVMTEANSVGIDRANGITGGPDAGVKVRLVNGSTTDTMQQLAALLERLRLDDNLRHLVTMNDYVLGELQRLQESLRSTVVTAAALLVAFLVLTVQSLTLLFEQYSRRIVVRRLFGLGAGRRYREFLRLFAIVWIAQLLGAIGLNALGFSPFAFGNVSSLVVLGIAGAALTIEITLSAIALAALERRRTINVLKGEF